MAVDNIARGIAGKALQEAGSKTVSPMTSTTLGGALADAVTANDTQPVRIGTDNKLYTAAGLTAANGLDTWTATTMPSDAGWTSATYGNGKFVAVAYDSNNAAYSTDGITWTASTLPSSADWQLATYGNGKFVIVS